jgi:RNA polymerase sigma-70 factor (ECF subfamily)
MSYGLISFEQVAHDIRIPYQERRPMEATESTLLLRSQQFDDDALAELQARLEPDLRRFVRRLIANREDTEDIVQAAFITLYRHIREITPTEKLRPFLYRVTRNLCYDYLRAYRRSESVSLDDDIIEVSVSFRADGDQPRPDDVVHWLLLKVEVEEAMERLPELQRQTLILYAEEGLSYAEIAEVMQTSIGTVKSRLHHAKTTLRRLLHPETMRAIIDEPEPTHSIENLNQEEMA